MNQLNGNDKSHWQKSNTKKTARTTIDILETFFLWGGRGRDQVRSITRIRVIAN